MKAEWLDRQTAAKELNRSIRRVLQFAGAGKIRSQQEPDPKTGRPATFLHAGDVERLREELQTRKKTASARSLAAIDKPRGAQELALLAANANGHVSLSPWFTLDEAARALRLPLTFLKRLIERGELPARNVSEGTKAAASWRLTKKDLEELKGKVAHA